MDTHLPELKAQLASAASLGEMCFPMAETGEVGPEVPVPAWPGCVTLEPGPEPEVVPLRGVGSLARPPACRSHRGVGSPSAMRRACTCCQQHDISSAEERKRIGEDGSQT